jgi:hypothetical protein
VLQLYSIFTSVFTLLGTALAYLIYTYGATAKYSEKIDTLAKNGLGYMFLGLVLMKIGLIPINIKLGMARKESKVNVPDQQVFFVVLCFVVHNVRLYPSTYLLLISPSRLRVRPAIEALGIGELSTQNSSKLSNGLTGVQGLWPRQQGRICLDGIRGAARYERPVGTLLKDS